MLKPSCRSNRRRYALTLPELEHSKAAVLNSLASLQSRRSYKHAIEDSFVGTVRSQGWL